MDDLREELAGAGFKPSDVANGTAYYGLGLRERGVTASALFHRPWRWGRHTYRSFFGVYGIMDVNAPRWLYGFQATIAVAFLIWALWARRTGLGSEGWGVIAVTAVVIVASLAAAFWRAWTFDFQAQGRYVFAIIPTVTLALLELTDRREDAIGWALGSALTIAGLASLSSAVAQLT
jgi:hypothetical protein